MGTSIPAYRMMNFKCSLLLTIAVCIGLVVSSPLRESNAQRLARGLPPNPPVFVRGLDARSQPSPISGARVAAPSSLPPVTLTGRLDVRSKDGKSIGHVRNWESAGVLGVNFAGANDDLLVKLTYSPSSPKELNILATNPQVPTPFYVGAGSFSITTPPILSAGKKGSVGFITVDLTPPGSRPFTPPARQGFSESAIWSIDPTHKLTAQWVNNDDTKPPTILAYDSRADSLFFVGDIDAYNANNNNPVSAVYLYLV